MTIEADVHKIIVIGESQARLPFIQTLSTGAIMLANDHNRDEIPNSYPNSALIDFGRLDVAKDIVLYTFGISHDFTWHYAWDSFVEKSLGMVFVADTLPDIPEIKVMLKGYAQMKQANLVVATPAITPEFQTYCQDLSIGIASDSIVEYKPDDVQSIRAVISTLLERVPESPAILRLREKFGLLHDC